MVQMIIIIRFSINKIKFQFILATIFEIPTISNFKSNRKSTFLIQIFFYNK